MVFHVELRAHEISILKSRALKIHENTIKFYRVMKCNLTGFSWYWKPNNETDHQIFMMFISWDLDALDFIMVILIFIFRTTSYLRA